MKKKDQAPEPGSRSKKNLRLTLTLTRETLQRLNEPLLGQVMGGALAGHTFTGNNVNESLCG